jgi:Alpha amylase, C-terminal all-beta domain
MQLFLSMFALCRFCQHRWQPIAGMVGFRNQVGSAPLTGWVSPSYQQIAFARGTYLTHGRESEHSRTRSTGALGFVALNNADSAWSTTFMTGLPAGSYCNVIDGTSVAGVCSGTAYVG